MFYSYLPLQDDFSHHFDRYVKCVVLNDYVHSALGERHIQFAAWNCFFPNFNGKFISSENSKPIEVDKENKSKFKNDWKLKAQTKCSAKNFKFILNHWHECRIVGTSKSVCNGNCMLTSDNMSVLSEIHMRLDFLVF